MKTPKQWEILKFIQEIHVDVAQILVKAENLPINVKEVNSRKKRKKTLFKLSSNSKHIRHHTTITDIILVKVRKATLLKSHFDMGVLL